MREIKEKFLNLIGETFEAVGIERFHGYTIILIIFALINLKDLKDLTNLSWWKKVIVLGSIFMAISMVFLISLRFFKIVEF